MSSLAVIAGVDSMQGLQAARILADRNVTVIATSASARHPAVRSRAISRLVVADESRQLVEELRLLGPELGDRPVIIPCTDGIVATLSAERQNLQQWYDIVLPAPGVVEMMQSKDLFAAWATANAFPIPRTEVVSNQDELRRASLELRYPVVVKPPFRAVSWAAHTTDKAYRAEDHRQLNAIYDRVASWSESLVVQEWIPGDDSLLYSCNLYYDRSGTIQVSFVARKLRQWPLDTGQSSLGEECRNDAVEQLARAVFERAGYVGLGYLEVKEDPRDGLLYVIEPNVGRPTGRSSIAEGGGVELLYTAFCDGAGIELPAQRRQRYTGVKWVHLRRDLQASIVLWRRGDLRLVDWMRSMRGHKVYALWSWSDPIPFLLDIASAFRKAALSSRGRHK